MHSKTGRPIKVGDQVVWKNGAVAAAGVVAQTTPESTTCNIQVVVVGNPYSQLVTASDAVHIEDALNAPAYVAPVEETPQSERISPASS